jgi:hypothetical protein
MTDLNRLAFCTVVIGPFPAWSAQSAIWNTLIFSSFRNRDNINVFLLPTACYYSFTFALLLFLHTAESVSVKTIAA